MDTPHPFDPSDENLLPFPEELPTYKPASYYFRREIRQSRSLERAVTVGRIACDELEQLRLWAGEKGVFELPEPDVMVNYFKESLAGETSHTQAITTGLFICHALEQFKAFVRGCGLIPPRWIILEEEAEDKGWDENEELDAV